MATEENFVSPVDSGANDMYYPHSACHTILSPTWPISSPSQRPSKGSDPPSVFSEAAFDPARHSKSSPPAPHVDRSETGQIGSEQVEALGFTRLGYHGTHDLVQQSHLLLSTIASVVVFDLCYGHGDKSLIDCSDDSDSAYPIRYVVRARVRVGMSKCWCRWDVGRFDPVDHF